MALEERTNPSHHHYDVTHQWSASSSPSSSSKDQECLESSAEQINTWDSESIDLEDEYHSPKESNLAALDRKIANMREDLDELLDDRAQFLKEIEATADTRLRMRLEREHRSEMLRLNQESLRKLRARFEARGEPLPGKEYDCDEESDPEYEPEPKPVRPKTWSAWWDELKGPLTSPEGREYMLAKDENPRSGDVYQLFLDELEPYYTAAGRKYVVLVYAE
jgi:hypothetical protein